MTTSIFSMKEPFLFYKFKKNLGLYVFIIFIKI
jgi:hypothetical protein